MIVGGTSAIAEHCARIWVGQSAVDLTLIGRDQDKLDAVAADLQVRGPQSEVRAVTADFENPERIQSQVDAITAAGTVDLVLIAHGSLPDQKKCQTDLKACEQALNINAISPAIYAEAFVRGMEQVDHGTLAIIGSVAGDRGRKSNYIYGAAKGLIERYAQGLQHRLAKTRVKVVLIKPGPTQTPMTASMGSAYASMARVEDVAGNIVAGIAAGKPVVYAPGKWAVIMLVIRNLPRFVFNKMNI
ncbi:short-chain dehydrogenase/reductase SDR [Achromobacter arsenitoxydans SY8]|uniref:Short-chain dehydrogenase/reductase SDR n=1 Tax=Achromobacter arsenitoxydans SY8 TaxID=477184 RepID=H0F4B8_9BURK|nr:short-chain dehydrogenase/reductase SDR [Achromobacter arsenitoxydans SY8]